MKSLSLAWSRCLSRLSGHHTAGWSEGFSLVETLVAMFIMSFGLMAAGQMMFAAMSASSLARSKGNAAILAQNKMEFLGDLFRQNQLSADLTDGNHGPEQIQITNPNTGAVLNRFNVAWNVSIVPDPRAGKVLKAKQVRVTISPIGSGTSANNQVGMNKIVNITSIFAGKL
jgi:prepilin-type N-terminal cleavage/methylation domain-containing protein